MTIRRAGMLLLAVLLLPCAGCGNDEGTTETAEVSAAAPTKDTLVQTLRDLLKAIEAGDLDVAAAHMIDFPGMSPEDVHKALPGFIEKREISGPGIDILAEKGTFGSLAVVFPERGAHWAERVKADAAKCYALSYNGAEVAGLWGGKTFKLIRLDDVGKLR